MNNILRNVLMRRSVSQFEERPIRDEDLMEILEEGKALSNAVNNQEWHFTILQNRKLIKQLYDVHTEQSSAIPDIKDFLPIEAPLLLIISGRKDNKFVEDAANMVFGSMMLVADKYGIGSCWLAAMPKLFETEAGKNVLDQMSVPRGYSPLCVGAFGYKKTVVATSVLSTEDNIVNIIK